MARRTFPLRLPDDVYDAVKAMAFFTDRPMNDLMLEAIRSYLAKQARSKLVRQVMADNDSRYRAALETLFDS